VVSELRPLKALAYVALSMVGAMTRSMEMEALAVELMWEPNG
jgi:hypothetical protein